MFSSTTKHRADFLIKNTKWLVEIEGGIFSKGRHVRPKGYEEDCRKYNIALFEGYKVLRIPSHWIAKRHPQLMIILNKLRS
jgi:very-short-patch-repair endonuclease